MNRQGERLRHENRRLQEKLDTAEKDVEKAKESCVDPEYVKLPVFVPPVEALRTALTLENLQMQRARNAEMHMKISEAIQKGLGDGFMRAEGLTGRGVAATEFADFVGAALKAEFPEQHFTVVIFRGSFGFLYCRSEYVIFDFAKLWDGGFRVVVIRSPTPQGL